MNVAVIVGSFRKDSINRQLAKGLMGLAPGMNFIELRIDDLPFYDPDIENDLPMPAVRFRRELKAAQAVLFVTPEYNRSIPAVLKNAIDWGSRPKGGHDLAGKAGAVIGASPGAIGTTAAQQHLRNILAVLDVHVMGQPEAYIQFKPGLVAADGSITDENVRGFLLKYMEQFARWAEHIAKFVV